MAEEEKKVETQETTTTEAPAEEEEEKPTHYKRPKVFKRTSYGLNNRSELVEFDAVQSIDGSLFVEGLAGIGTTSTVVAAYLIGQLKLPIVAVFNSSEFPAICAIHSWVATPAVRIYGNSEICVAISDTKLNPSKDSHMIWDISQALLDFARTHKCKAVVTVDGFPVQGTIEKQIQKMAAKVDQARNPKKINIQRRESDPTDLEKLFEKVGFLTTDEEVGKQLIELEHEPIKVGNIMGVTGALLTSCYIGDPETPHVTAILAPDTVEIPDQRGALLVVKILCKIWNITVSIDALQQHAEKLAEKIKSTIDDIQKQINAAITPKPVPNHMYS